MDLQNKLQELMDNEEFVEAYGEVTNAQEVVELYSRYGVEVPMDIAQELFEQDEECELDEDALDEVAGGGIVKELIGAAYYGAGYLGGRIAGWDKKKSKKYAKDCQKVGRFLGSFF